MPEEKKRVLHINCNYLTTALHQTMIEHLDAQGVKSTVFAPTWSLRNAVVKPGPNVIARECFHRRDRYVYHYKQGKIRRAVERELDVSAFDCIHAYTVFTDGNCARTLSARYGIPYVVAVRSTDVYAFWAKMIHLRGLGVNILRDAAAVFFLSEPYRRLVLTRYVPERYREAISAKSYIIGNGIDDFWHNNAGTANGAEHLERIQHRRLRVIYAGSIIPRKNLTATLSAVHILQKRGWDVVFQVVGKAEDQEIYGRLIQDPAVEYTERQPKEKLIQCYRGCDIFVMPSRKETFGLVYAEAMSQGLPVIYTKGEGFDGQIPDGSAGFSVDAGDPEDIADKVELAAGDYRRMSEAALQMAGQFRWDAICRKYMEIYMRQAAGATGNG